MITIDNIHWIWCLYRPMQPYYFLFWAKNRKPCEWIISDMNTTDLLRPNKNTDKNKFSWKTVLLVLHVFWDSWDSVQSVCEKFSLLLRPWWLTKRKHLRWFPTNSMHESQVLLHNTKSDELIDQESGRRIVWLKKQNLTSEGGRLQACVGHLATPYLHTWEKLTCCYQWRDHPVKVIEERHQVECQLSPSLPLTPWESVGIHDISRVIEPRAGHNWALHIPMNMVGNQGQVEEQGQPLPCKEEENVKEQVK